MTDSQSTSTAFQNFLDGIARRAQLDTSQAERVARATLATLGDSISGAEAAQLATWLPPELQPELAARIERAQPFDRPQFLNAIALHIRADDEAEVEKQVKATLVTLRTAAPSGELDDTIAQLPRALTDLFS